MAEIAITQQGGFLGEIDLAGIVKRELVTHLQGYPREADQLKFADTFVVQVAEPFDWAVEFSAEEILAEL